MATYTVLQNDTLWKIAKQFYGDGDLWPRIHQANLSLIPDENKIRSGMHLFIPDGSTAPPQVAQPQSNGGPVPPPRSLGDVAGRILAVAAQRRGIPYQIEPPPDGVNTLDCSLYVIVTYRDAD